jgi:hypothetical protein
MAQEQSLTEAARRFFQLPSSPEAHIYGGVMFSPAGGFAWRDDTEPGALRLGELLHLNRDAVRFYAAAEKKPIPAPALVLLQELKQLHEAAAGDMLRYAQRTGVFPPPAAGPPSGFEDLTAELVGGLNSSLVEHLEAVEDAGLESLETAMSDSTQLGEQMFFASQLCNLGMAHEHLKTLKSVIAENIC